MSASGIVSSPSYKGTDSSVITLLAFNGDTEMTAEHDPRRISPKSFQSHSSPFLHISTGSSPSESPSVDFSTLPADTSHSQNLFDQDFELGLSQQLTGESLDIHSLQTSNNTTPEYRPLPPLSPRSILATLDDIANTGPKKKSHARKQPAGHIPRPRNAFILFRCLFVSQQSVPASIEKDHRNISRIAGRVWKAMSEEEREPWVKAADIEKARHEQRWPGYRYNPVQNNPPQVKRIINGNNPASGARVQNPTAGPSRMENSASERPGRTLIRTHAVQPAFKQPELPIQYSSQIPVQLHAPLPRIASVPPTLGSENDMHDPRNLEPLSIQFTDPFKSNHISTSGFDHYSSIPTPPSAYSFEGSLPPDSPIVFTGPPTNFGRIPHRRSSSCPPLPPPGMSGFSFNSNPIMLQTPSNQYSSIPLVDSDMDSSGLFRNPFSFNSPFSGGSPFAAGSVNTASVPSNHTPTDEHRLIPGPDPLSFPTPRHIHLDTNSRLIHRRGSSLDRALANSTLAGAFGGFTRSSQHWTSPWAEHPPLSLLVQRSQPIALPESQFIASTNHYNPSQLSETSLSSSEAETPGLSPSPQSSFQNAEVYQTRPLPEESYDVSKEFYLRTFTPKTMLAPSTQSPLGEAFKLAHRKVSGRLFGSQGARLGLDLDLESPLSLNISFKEGQGVMDTQCISHPSTISSTGPDSPSFPYTPASAPGLSPSVFTYSYTQALMDPELGVPSQEFYINSDK